MVLVRSKTDRDWLVEELEKEIAKRNIEDMKVWGFNALPNTANIGMLRSLMKNPNEQDNKLAPGGTGSNQEEEKPVIIVATHDDCVGVNFFPRCFVLMTFKPTNLREFI